VSLHVEGTNQQELVDELTQKCTARILLRAPVGGGRLLIADNHSLIHAATHLR